MTTTMSRLMILIKTFGFLVLFEWKQREEVEEEEEKEKRRQKFEIKAEWNNSSYVQINIDNMEQNERKKKIRRDMNIDKENFCLFLLDHTERR